MSIQWIDDNTEQFVDDNYLQWVRPKTGEGESCVHADNTYIYNSYGNELEIYELDTQQKIVHMDCDFVVTGMWASQENLFIGTLSSGIVNLAKDNINSSYSSEEIYNSITTYKKPPKLTSNRVRSISGKDGCLACCTNSGVDFFKLEPNGYRSYTTISGAYNEFLYSERELYYTVSGSSTWHIYKVDPITDWETTNSFLSTNIDSLSNINNIFGLKVTKNTKGQHILFLLTDLGVVLINYEEDDYVYINERGN